jgi:16S rRNA (cytosine1402-N4)-methyltransferase
VGADGAQEGGGVDARYATAYHAPVLAAETLDLLVTDPAGLYVDGTLGGGGHSAALLDALGEAALVIGETGTGRTMAAPWPACSSTSA